MRPDMREERDRAARLFAADPHSSLVSGYLEGVYAERERCDLIVREEWHRAVAEMHLAPGSQVEKFMGTVINRIRKTGEGE